MSSKLSFSLAPKAKPIGEAPPLRVATAFETSEEDVPEAPASNSKGNPRLVASAPRAVRKRKRKDEVDEQVYQYDEVWDNMKDAERKAKEALTEQTKERMPKYIGSLLNSAATRKLDHLRAEEKMIQRERETEGDEFADKDKFVTQAYKDQLVEMRKAEEEEKKREELEQKKNRGGSTGMAHFYKSLLDRSSEQHAAAVAATEHSPAPVVGPTLPQSLTIRPPTAPISDLDLARAAKEQGKEVELNDDNQIVDKRELLSAGLNLSAPNSRRLYGLTPASQRRQVDLAPSHQAAGAAASLKEIRERQRKLLEEQMEEERERIRKEGEKEAAEELARVVQKRNGDEEVKSAKERYLERKRKKLEEAQADPPPS